jgi:hypothetical protein
MYKGAFRWADEGLLHPLFDSHYHGPQDLPRHATKTHVTKTHVTKTHVIKTHVIKTHVINLILILRTPPRIHPHSPSSSLASHQPTTHDAHPNYQNQHGTSSPIFEWLTC